MAHVSLGERCVKKSFPRTRLASDVTRWLTVVVFGCAVLETAQPMIAAESEAAPLRSDATVIYPKASSDHSSSDIEAARHGGGSSMMLGGALLLAMGGGWLLLKRRGMLPARAIRAERKIVIEETRSLGNRQYLVVAGYEGRKFLLGVTTGQIQMLSRLDSEDVES